MFTHRTRAGLRPGRYRDPLMSLKVTGSRRMPVLAVTGEVDLSNAALLTEFAELLLRDHPPRLVLDLAKVTFFGADGVNAVLRIGRAATADGAQLLLRDPSRIALRVLTATCVINVFQIDITAARTRPMTRPVEHHGS